ncbi:hypothetical protein SKAU_G00356930 [Synaphobranchus kaupii]|uniref:Uncharacterized protein n=1 Tax=Synaphobranchus kaupii TaxID=118154 RepID=A0A9Q1EHL2_SYNKA|nr:hypothetical protein SKAU_G00356930 [Synaphobranchus kaupii]
MYSEQVPVAPGPQDTLFGASVTAPLRDVARGPASPCQPVTFAFRHAVGGEKRRETGGAFNYTSEAAL